LLGLSVAYSGVPAVHWEPFAALVLEANVGEWDMVLGDPVVATAILDRMLHHSHIVTIRGDSYRLRGKRRTGLIRADAPGERQK
jgi:IstB-like ATP binding protein